MRAVATAVAIAAAVLLGGSWNATTAVETHRSMDLVWAETDPNGYPLNPDWYGQSGTSHGTTITDIDASSACDYFHNPGGRLEIAGCTTQPVTVDERRPFRGALPDLVGYVCKFASDRREQLDRNSVHGHLNWRVATYTGNVSFDDYQNPVIGPSHVIPGDGDLDFALTRPDHRGYVLASGLQDGPGIGLEANRNELGALGTAWWSAFRDGFERDSSAARARAALHDAPAVAVGLLGIDTKHGAHTELHPLFVLFARTSRPGAAPEHWVFFARNWGYEGACSSQEHLLGGAEVSVRLASPSIMRPLLAGLSVSPRTAESWISAKAGSAQTLVTVHFPRELRRPVVVGEFDLCDGACGSARAGATPSAVAGDETDRSERDEGSRSREEGRLTPLIALLSPPQRAAFLAAVKRIGPHTDTPEALYAAFESAVGGKRETNDLLQRFASADSGGAHENERRPLPLRP